MNITHQKNTSEPITEMVTCQYCKCPLNPSSLKSHIEARCPKSPIAIKHKAQLSKHSKAHKKNENVASKPILKKTILIRARLERLFRELNNSTTEADDIELAKVFKAFYTMYVWRGEKNHVAGPRNLSIDEHGQISNSIRTVSGGLPSLGKRAK